MGMADAVKPVDYRLQDGEEVRSIGLIQEDFIPGIAPGGHVVDSTLVFDARWPGHGSPHIIGDMINQDLAPNPFWAVNSCWRQGGRGVAQELCLLVWWPAAVERLAYLCLTLSTRLCSRISDKTNGPVPILFPNLHTPRSSF